MGLGEDNWGEGELAVLSFPCPQSLHNQPTVQGQGSMKETSARDREELFMLINKFHFIFSVDLILNVIIIIHSNYLF